MVCGKYRYFSEPPPAPLRCAPPRSACLRLSHAQRRYGPIIAVATHAPFATHGQEFTNCLRLPPRLPFSGLRGLGGGLLHVVGTRHLTGVPTSAASGLLGLGRRGGRVASRSGLRRRTASRQSFRLRSTAHGLWTVHTYTRTHTHTCVRTPHRRCDSLVKL